MRNAKREMRNWFIGENWPRNWDLSVSLPYKNSFYSPQKYYIHNVNDTSSTAYAVPLLPLEKAHLEYRFRYRGEVICDFYKIIKQTF